MGQIQQQVLGAIRSQKGRQIIKNIETGTNLQEAMVQANEKAAQVYEAKLAAKRISSYLNSNARRNIDLEGRVLFGTGAGTINPGAEKKKAREYMKEKKFGEYASSTYNKARVASALAHLNVHGDIKQHLEDLNSSTSPEEREGIEELLRKNPPKEGEE